MRSSTHLHPITKSLLGILGLFLVFAVIDPFYPVALLFWRQTVPLSNAVLPTLAKLFHPLTAAVIAVWGAAALIAAGWLWGLWRWVRPRRLPLNRP